MRYFQRVFSLLLVIGLLVGAMPNVIKAEENQSSVDTVTAVNLMFKDFDSTKGHAG